MAMSDKEILVQCKEWFKASKGTNDDYFKEAERNYDYYIGKQWRKSDLDELQLQGRAALTINKILPVVNLLSGAQRDNRQDFTVRPLKGGTANVAKVLTALAKHTVDRSNGEWQISAMFDDGIIGSKGWIALDVDYSRDPLNGDIKLVKVSPFDVLEDCDAKEYDLNESGKFIFRMWGWTKDDLILNYPKKKRQIESSKLGDHYRKRYNASEEFSDYRDETRPSEDPLPGTDGPDMARYEVKECWWRTRERRSILVNTETMESVVVDPEKKKLAQAIANYSQTGSDAHNATIATIMGGMNLDYVPGQAYEMIERVVPVLHKTIFVGDILLEHKDDPFEGISQFPIIRFTPYWVDGYEMAVVDNLIGPQDEHNKRRSQALHHLNQTANSGWIGDEDAVVDWGTVEKFGSKPGMIIKKRKNKELERITPAPISEGHLTLDQMAGQDIKDISGVNTELQGATERELSGRAMALQIQQGMQINKVVFDNTNYTLQILGDMLIEMIRRTGVYSEQEVKLVVDEQKVKVDMQQLGSMQLGNYGVKMVLSKYSPTLRISNFYSLMEGIKEGLPIDPRFPIESSDMHDREEIVEDMQQKQQSAAQAAQAAQQLEQDKFELEKVKVMGELEIDAAKVDVSREKLRVDDRANKAKLKQEKLDKKKVKEG